mmetsp:Transcript_49531/g.78433  ORF Transcript_49531/g.78433 Transcript_49531/m.78433 type:complete len:201 (-) Transcript_49531:261-863(-)
MQSSTKCTVHLREYIFYIRRILCCDLKRNAVIGNLNLNILTYARLTHLLKSIIHSIRSYIESQNITTKVIFVPEITLVSLTIHIHIKQAVSKLQQSISLIITCNRDVAKVHVIRFPISHSVLIRVPPIANIVRALASAKMRPTCKLRQNLLRTDNMFNLLVGGSKIINAIATAFTWLLIHRYTHDLQVGFTDSSVHLDGL